MTTQTTSVPTCEYMRRVACEPTSGEIAHAARLIDQADHQPQDRHTAALADRQMIGRELNQTLFPLTNGGLL